jgi:hypothetical protein
MVMAHDGTTDGRLAEVLTEIAEGATAGVTHHMRRGEGPLVAPLQVFAAAAWAGAHGALAPAEVREEAQRALEALRGVTGARAPRRFLTGVLRRLDRLVPVPFDAPADVATLDDLARLVDGRGVVSVRAARLRDAVGARRLDALTRLHIEMELDARGLGVFPGEVPPDGRAWVRVYAQDHPVGLLAVAAATPGPEGDRLMRMAAALLAGMGDA